MERPPQIFIGTKLFFLMTKFFRFTVCTAAMVHWVVKLKIATLDQKHGKNSDGS